MVKSTVFQIAFGLLIIGFFGSALLDQKETLKLKDNDLELREGDTLLEFNTASEPMEFETTLILHHDGRVELGPGRYWVEDEDGNLYVEGDEVIDSGMFRPW